MCRYFTQAGRSGTVAAGAGDKAERSKAVERMLNHCAGPPVARFLKIHEDLRAGVWPNTRMLARKLEVDRRTIRRDIDYMRDQLHAPIAGTPTNRIRVSPARAPIAATLTNRVPVSLPARPGFTSRVPVSLPNRVPVSLPDCIGGANLKDAFADRRRLALRRGRRR